MLSNWKFVCIFAAAYTLVQGCVHLAFVIWSKNASSVRSYECIYPDNIGSYIFVYINYFYENECLVWLYFIKQSNNADIVYKTDDVSYFELHKQTCTVLDVFWLITSVLLIVGALSKNRSMPKLIFPIPWIAVTCAINLFDIYEISRFVLHMLKCETSKEWLESIGVRNIHRAFNELPKMPPILMFLISIRFLIFLLINATFLICVYKSYAFEIENDHCTLKDVSKTINTTTYDIIPKPTTHLGFLQNFEAPSETDLSNSDSSSEIDDNNDNKEVDANKDKNRKVRFASFTKYASSPELYGAVKNAEDAKFSERNIAVQIRKNSTTEIDRNLPWSYFPGNQPIVLPKFGNAARVERAKSDAATMIARANQKCTKF